MAANKTLKEIAPHYHRFEDNQVLTDEALNRVLDHVNYQDKLTRTGLIGVGILCGLKLAASQSSIKLTKGIAITTDGDILYKETTEFKGFKKFTDENVLYEHFLQDEVVMDLYELEEDTSPTNVFPLNEFQSKIKRENMVALLYLESFLKDEEDCSGIDCNAQGLEVVNNIRVLVTSPENARVIALRDSVFSSLLDKSGGEVISTLNNFLPVKVVLNSDNASSIADLKNAYTRNFFDLAVQIESLGGIKIFRDLTDTVALSISQFLKNLKPENLNFQYIYDFYKDLATAYNELLDLLKANNTICCPDFAAFPKHVLIGGIDATRTSLRHSFYASPIHDQAGTLQNLQAHYLRIMNMIRDFNPGRQETTRITPSRNGHHKLGERALPFYYNLKTSGNPDEMASSWQARQTDDKLWNYYHHNYPAPQFDPLDHCLEDHDFYRIEGHVGHEIKGVLKSVESLRKQKGLDFKVIPVAVGEMADELTVDFDEFRAQFEDLQVVLQAWNEEQKCMMKNATDFLTRFSKTEKGTHLDYIGEVAGTAVSGRPVTDNLNNVNRYMERVDLTGSLMGGTAIKNFILNKPRQKVKDNAVLKYVDKNENSTGNLWGKNINRSDSGSDIQLKITDGLKGAVRAWEEEFQIAVMDIPASLLGKLKVTEDNKLMNISDFTEDNLQKYIKALNDQCETARTSKIKLQKQLLKEGSKLKESNFMENYFNVLNRILSTCCLGEKVTVLYQEILDRKKELLSKFILKNYINSHPGAEHKAGVPKGGTFVLLYYSRPRRNFLKAAEFLKMNRITAGNVANIPVRETNIIAGNNRLLENLIAETGNLPNLANLSRDLVGNIPDFELLNPGIFDALRGRETGIAHGTVIGDLCLPYVCCTDTPALNFVFPEPAVSLFIPKDHVCLAEGTDADEVLLEVSPADASVKAFIENKETVSLVSQNGDNWFFNPNKVKPEQFGKIISFTVNDQKVSENIRVVQQPEPAFTISPEITYNNDYTVANIRVENTSKQIAGQTFHWNFSPFGEVTNNAISFEYPVKVRPGETFEVKIKLTATNGPCSKSVEQDLVHKVPKEEQDKACLETADRNINESLQILREFLRANSRAIVQFQPFYQDQVFPLYKLILSELEEALDGKLDNQIFEMILKIQSTIQDMQSSRLNGIQQAFIQIIYYETLLLYFYVQQCRNKAITAKTDITDSWLSFTKLGVVRWKEGTRVMLQTDPVTKKIQVVTAEMKDHISNPLLKILLKIVEMLNSDFD